MAKIPGLMDIGYNKPYQEIVRTSVSTAILQAVIDPETHQSVFRNEDIIEALLDIQAIMLSTSKVAQSRTRLRQCCDDFAKRLRKKTVAARAEVVKSGPIGEVVYLDEKQ